MQTCFEKFSSGTAFEMAYQVDIERTSLYTMVCLCVCDSTVTDRKLFKLTTIQSDKENK